MSEVNVSETPSNRKQQNINEKVKLQYRIICHDLTENQVEETEASQNEKEAGTDRHKPQTFTPPPLSLRRHTPALMRVPTHSFILLRPKYVWAPNEQVHESQQLWDALKYSNIITSQTSWQDLNSSTLNISY